MSISPSSEAKELERLVRLKYYNELKRQITFTLGQLSIFKRLVSTLSIIVKEGPYWL